jgi:hypothetical protein
MRKSLATFLLSASALAALAVQTAGPASAEPAARSAPADQIITATYPVTGSTFISKLNTTIPLGPGTLASSLDLQTSALTATLTLPPATGSFKILGFIPVTATTEFIQVGTATGTLSNGVVTTTAHVTLKLTSLKAAGIPIFIGDECQTSTPATITVTSQPGFNLLSGGNLAGTYTIPQFSHCGLATFLINLTIPGPNNTITLTLGAAKIG